MAHLTVFVSKRLRSRCHLFLLGSALAVGLTSAPAAEAPPPTITTQPGVSDVVAGTDATLTVVATGTGTRGYQWRRGGTLIAGATGPTLTLRDVEMVDAGLYDVVVSDGLSTTTSNLGRVFVRPFAYPNAVAPVKSFAPRFERELFGEMRHALAAPNGASYVTGKFTAIDGLPRVQVARFLASGAVDPAFVPAEVRGDLLIEVLQDDGKLVIAGTITHVGGVARAGIARLNADGSLDTGFDPGSGFTVPGGFASVNALALQTDGGILVGGRFDLCDGVAQANLARLNRNGSRDPTFAAGGAPNGEVYAIAMGPDTSIVIGGAFTTYAGIPREKLARIMEDGELDLTFDATGHGILQIAAMITQPDGKVLVGATPTLLKRFNVDGSPDDTFAAPYIWHVNAIFLRPDGTIIVGSRRRSMYLSPAELVLLSSDGSRWTGGPFGIDFGFDRSMYRTSVTGLAVLSSGQILVVGEFVKGTTILRLSSTGAIDPNFAPDPAQPATVHQLAPLPGGKWLVGGDFSMVDGVRRIGLARINADGSLDPAFNCTANVAGVYPFAVQADGRIITTNGSKPVRLAPDGELDPAFNVVEPGILGTPVIVQPDGRVLLGADNIAQGPRAGHIVRLQPDGALDGSFSSDAALTVTYSNFGFSPNTYLGHVASLALTADGRVLAAGLFTEVGGAYRGCIARLTAAGSIDTTFNADPGFPTIYPLSAPFSEPNPTACVLLPDGRILANGLFSSYNEASRNGLVRINPDGSLDAGFVPGASFGVGALLPQGDGRAISGLQRVNADGSLDPTFAVDNLSGTAFTTHAGAFTAAGELVVAGTWTEFSDFTGRGLMLLRSVTPLPPRITAQPLADAATAGGFTTLSIRASGAGPIAYQWQHLASGISAQGVAAATDTWIDIPGATGVSYSIPSVQSFHGGSYRVVVTSEGVSVPSDPAMITVHAAAPSNSRLLNLSARAQALTGDDVLIPGFVIAGTGNKRLLIRAVGPTLGKPPFNLGGVLPDPRLRLLKRNPTTQAFEEIAANDNWGTNPNAAAITQTAADLFAFGFNDDREAALLLDVAPGEYTVIARGVNDVTGLAIVELYDADAASPAARLANISNRGFAGVGDHVMIPGFVVSSEGPKTLLIRVVGPTLGSFGVAGTMTDPKLTVYSGQTAILENDNWSDSATSGNAAYTAQVATQVSAFPLTAGSKDAAFVVTLPPGSYTVVGSSAVAGGAGVVLVELYVVP